MCDRPGSSVELVAVDEVVLEELVAAAAVDAGADEVTPWRTPGDRWSTARVAWLREFHRDRRLGLDGPLREATWAIVADGQVVGSVRLKRTDHPDVLETGLWLRRSARGRGVGRCAVAAIVRKAAALGATVLIADTTRSNAAALGVLTRSGFAADPPDGGGHVRAMMRLAG